MATAFLAPSKKDKEADEQKKLKEKAAEVDAAQLAAEVSALHTELAEIKSMLNERH